MLHQTEVLELTKIFNIYEDIEIRTNLCVCAQTVCVCVCVRTSISQLDSLRTRSNITPIPISMLGAETVISIYHHPLKGNLERGQM